MSDDGVKKKLNKIGEALKKAKPGTALHRKLMRELDRLLGTEEKPRDHEAEEAWEKSRR